MQDLRKLSFHSLMSDGTSPLFVPSFPFLICLYCSPCHSCISRLPCPSCPVSSISRQASVSGTYHTNHVRWSFSSFVSPADETKYSTHTRQSKQSPDDLEMCLDDLESFWTIQKVSRKEVECIKIILSNKILHLLN